jgi:hypothetical protein
MSGPPGWTARSFGGPKAAVGLWQEAQDSCPELDNVTSKNILRPSCATAESSVAASALLSLGLGCGSGSAIATGVASQTDTRIDADQALGDQAFGDQALDKQALDKQALDKQALDKAALSFEERFTNESVGIEGNREKGADEIIRPPPVVGVRPQARSPISACRARR